MQAIVQEGYGSPAVLKLREIAQPSPGPKGVLVEVHAAAVNALDWHVARGLPMFLRLLEGLRRPRNRVRGVDLAGRVMAVGSEVTRFKPGDDVFGGSKGSFTEYTVTTEARLALKPPALGWAEAAALYVAGLTALQGLRDRGRVQPGQRVLINGAGGGVGTFAVQLARWLGAQVTAVTRTESVELVRGLGANQIIDYTREDFTRRAERYDVIFDIGGTQPLGNCRRVMTRRGILVAVGAPAGKWLAPANRLLAAAAITPFVSQRLLPFISHNDAADLALLAELATTGKLTPVIDRSYPLAQAAEAVRYVGEGCARGKVAIRVR